MVGCYCSRSFAFTFLSSSIFTYYIHTSYLVLYLEVSVSYYLSLAIFFCDLHTLSHVPFSLSHYLSLWLAYTLSCCFIFFLSLSYNLPFWLNYTLSSFIFISLSLNICLLLSFSHYLPFWLTYTLSWCFIFFLSLSLTIFLMLHLLSFSLSCSQHTSSKSLFCFRSTLITLTREIRPLPISFRLIITMLNATFGGRKMGVFLLQTILSKLDITFFNTISWYRKWSK